MTVFRSEEVAAWTLHETDGLALSVSVVGEDIYLLLDRDGTFMIEQFDAALNMDAALSGEDTTPATAWSGMDHLEGRTVSIVADGVVQADQVVTGGTITLVEAANKVEIGLAYTHLIEPLPPSAVASGGAGRAVRLVEAIFRLEDTAALRVDTGRGMMDVTLRQLGEDPILGAPPPLVSGDISVRALGWKNETDAPLWRIEQSIPLSFTMLSVTTELKVND